MQMEPMAFMMAILGCADDGMACREQRVEPVRYASARQCRAAVPAALERNSDIDYPVIAAACRAAPRTIAREGKDAHPPRG